MTGNLVAPRFTTNNQVIFNKWYDYPAFAIQACLKSNPDDCIEVRASSLTVPEDDTPYDYNFKFRYQKQGVNYQDEFSLASQNENSKDEELKW